MFSTNVPNYKPQRKPKEADLFLFGHSSYVNDKEI